MKEQMLSSINSLFSPDACLLSPGEWGAMAAGAKRMIIAAFAANGLTYAETMELIKTIHKRLAEKTTWHDKQRRG